MRYRSPPYMQTMLTVGLGLAATGESRKAKRQDTFEITSPKLGQTIGVSKEHHFLAIQWSVPSALTDRPVLIRLAQGQNLSSLSYVESVDATAPNNGSYDWYAEYENALFSYDGDNAGAPSGCNYSISLKTLTDEVFSPYFVIVNPGDGGIPTNATCPQEEGLVRPSNGTYEPTAAAASTTSSATSSSGQSGGHSTNATNAVSQTTLIVAVVVPVIVLLLAFGAMLWLAFHRGWLVRRARQPHNAQDAQGDMKGAVVFEDNPAGHAGSPWQKMATSHRPPNELPGRDQPYQIGGGEVHQLYGDESRREL
ncbi:hypothetical protein LTR85_006635 [Meristemomyces frigidus]|nr:hypothetical protein LTR85_006635 [Meristemomyces frigidus]